MTPQPPPAPSRRQRLARSLLTLCVLVGVLLAAQRARAALGVEWSAEGLRETVHAYGRWAPAIYLLLTTGRQLLVLPSVLMLTTAGLLFGAWQGALLGALGITLNAVLLYCVARFMGRQWVLPVIRERWPSFEARARSAGPAFVALMTGHPAGVLTPVHLAAGVTGITLPLFVLVVFPAALARAGLYAVLGANLLHVGSPGFWLASGGIAAVTVATLLHAPLRRRIFVAPQPATGPDRPAQ